MDKVRGREWRRERAVDKARGREWQRRAEGAVNVSLRPSISRKSNKLNFGRYAKKDDKIWPPSSSKCNKLDKR